MSNNQNENSPAAEHTESSTAQADLALIRKMMLEAQTSAALDGRYLVLWGVVLALPQVFTFLGALFIDGFSNESLGTVWFVVLGIGIMGSIILGFMHPRGPVNLGVRLYSSVWIGFCLSMCLLFILAVTGHEPLLFSLAIVAPIITGLAFFATAAIINLGWLRWVALGWWILGVLVSFLEQSSFIGVIYSFAYLGLMAGPGLAIMRLGKKV